MIHFMFAIGAFLIPLAATPFISAHLPTHCHLLSTSTYCKNYYPLQANYCTPTNESGLYNASNDECITAPSVKFQYVYWIATIPLLLAVPGLMFYSIKQQCCFDLKKCLKRNVGEKIEEEELTDEQENDEAASHILPYPNTRAFVYTIRFLSACFIFSFIGYEVAFGTYLFAYAVEGKPHFNKKMASILSSLYWGTFAFLRLVSVVLSWCKVPPSVLLTGNLTGNLVASVILLFWPESQIATWVGSALMGTSFASVLPNSIVWLSKTTPVTGKAIAVIGAGALSGEIILPTLVGVFIDILGPRFFPYFSIIAAIVSAVLMFSLFAVARMCKIQPDEEYQTPESEQQRDQSEDTPLIERPQDTVTENTDE
jgi:FHS family Na+ dependent glucose MFS transporter 1